MNKLHKFAAERKVWIGGLSEGVNWKDLEKHFEETCGTKPKVTEITNPKKGTGVCAFESAEEAEAAIAAVNGSEFNGATLEVDTWTEKEKKEGEERPKRKFGVLNRVNINKVDPSMKV